MAEIPALSRRDFLTKTGAGFGAVALSSLLAENPLRAAPAIAPLAHYAASGRNCPRKFLIEQSAKLLEPLHAAALDNVNSTTDYWQTMQTLSATDASTRTLRVQYFALLREQAGRSDESLSTSARTPAELYAELTTKYGFTLPHEMLKVAVNAEFGDWNQPLQGGDAVVFIPPVAGG